MEDWEQAARRSHRLGTFSSWRRWGGVSGTNAEQRVSGLLLEEFEVDGGELELILSLAGVHVLLASAPSSPPRIRR